MPFASDKQRRFLWSQKPEVAKKFAEHHAGGGVAGGNMFNNKGLKKLTQKDRYGNTMTYEFEAPVKPLDPTALMKAQMELEQPEVDVDIFGMEGFADGGMPGYDHPGEPKGTDTVPAWLTPGEFVMNAEATEMYQPLIEKMNDHGRMIQKAQGGPVPRYEADGGLIDKILTHEGGFVDDPDDRGGRTNFGITQKTWGDRGDVADLTRDQAREFYESEYDRFGVDRFPEELRPQIFDMIVNHGYGNTVGILQGLGGVEQDRKVGPGTLGALEGKTADDLADARIGFFDEIIANDPSQAKFEKGWKKRAESWRPQHKQVGGPITSTWQPPVPPSAIPDLPVEEEVPVRKKRRGPRNVEGPGWDRSGVGNNRARAQAQRERTPEQIVPEPERIGGRMGRAEELAEEDAIFQSDQFLESDADGEAIASEPVFESSLTESLAETEEDPQAKGEAKQLKKTPNKEIAAIGEEARAADPSAFDRVLETFGKAAGNLFDEEELATTALLYLGSRAMGYSHAGSMRWSANRYLNQLQAKKDSAAAAAAKKDERVFDLVKSGKADEKSLEVFKRTGNVNDLRPNSAGNVKRISAKPETYYDSKGRAHKVWEYEGPGGKYLGNSAGAQIPDDAFNSLHQDAYKVQGTKEYNNRVNSFRKISEDQVKSLRNQFGVAAKTEDGTVYKTDINPATQAGEIAKWAAKNDVNAEDLAGLVESAYHDALNDERQDGKKVRDLTPYLNDLVVRKTVGNPDLFKTDDGTMVSSEKLAVVNQVIGRQLPEGSNIKAVADQYYNKAAEEWNKLGPEGQAKYNARANDHENGFYVFIANDLKVDNRMAEK